ncbi:tumor necrosis factor receptor superfamily member 5-like isoform X2 [Pristis pectinata]|uniref:tumor necrosis factor receptor superfamily member 5-like isoform X2 n=1 Tax=Pristis pectinata TaxID=685728 RepID=UPI00223D1F81|nr:tumor necrosis factor receptor superfamily member 5-like isoform X2 [Pristis pectinata]
MNMCRRFSCYLLLLGILLNVCPGTCLTCKDNEYRWVINSEEGCCPKCPPGQYLKKRCESFKDKAECETCQNGEFTDRWNTYGSCAPCRTCLEAQGFQVEKECNKTSNVKCSCRPGYTPDTSKICMKICDKGEQLKSGDSNTCEQCPDGFYSDQKGTKSCKPWTRCNDTSQRGSATEDVVCGPAKSNPTTASEGRLSTPETTYRTILLRTTTAVSVTITEKPSFHCCFGDRNYTKPPVPVQEEFNDITSVQVKN